MIKYTKFFRKHTKELHNIVEPIEELYNEFKERLLLELVEEEFTEGVVLKSLFKNKSGFKTNFTQSLDL